MQETGNSLMHDLENGKLFDLKKTFEYILSIQVSLNGFSFSITSQDEVELLFYKNIQLKISSTALISRRFEEWFKSEEVLQQPFHKIRITVFSEKFTLIPEQFFNAVSKNEITKLLFTENSDLEIAENSIGKFKTRLVFVLPNGLNDVIRREIGACEITHPVKTILNNLPEQEKESGAVMLFDTTNFYLVIFSPNKILLANNFKIAAATDVLYYILTSLKQLDISTSKINLHIIGPAIKTDEAENLLTRYFTAINKLELAPFSFSQKLVATAANK